VDKPEVSNAEFTFNKTDGTIPDHNRKMLEQFERPCGSCRSGSAVAIMIGMGDDGQHIHLGMNYSMEPEALLWMLSAAVVGLQEQIKRERSRERVC
jgi:hypothetical protein